MFNKYNLILLLDLYTYSYQYIVDINNIKLRKTNFGNNYLNINPELNNIKKCDICKLKVNTKENIPINCTIPIGCPFNRKINKY